MNYIQIDNRNNITDILPTDSVGCEIGVFEGDFSKVLLDSNKFKKLYLVDYFSGPAWNFNKHYPDASVLYDKVKNRFSDDSRVSVIKNDSVSFLKTTNLLFDFIYIDTIHSYEYLSQELLLAHKLIKKEGYLCGHDYCQEFDGVIRAVQDFIKQFKYPLSITLDKPYCSFIIKI